MKLYLFRHAAVEEKYLGCYNGHIDISATPQGIEKAKKNFQEIAHISFDKVYASPLKRAKQTIKSFNLKQKIHWHEALKEKSWGRHEGKNYDEVVLMEGKAYENFEQWLEVLDGEESESFQKRVKDFLSELANDTSEQVLLVCHAGVIYTMIQFLQGVTREKAFSLGIKYGEYYVLEWDRQGVYFNNYLSPVDFKN